MSVGNCVRRQHHHRFQKIIENNQYLNWSHKAFANNTVLRSTKSIYAAKFLIDTHIGFLYLISNNVMMRRGALKEFISFLYFTPELPRLEWWEWPNGFSTVAKVFVFVVLSTGPSPIESGAVLTINNWSALQVYHSIRKAYPHWQSDHFMAFLILLLGRQHVSSCNFLAFPCQKLVWDGGGGVNPSHLLSPPFRGFIGPYYHVACQHHHLCYWCHRQDIDEISYL